MFFFLLSFTIVLVVAIIGYARWFFSFAAIHRHCHLLVMRVNIALHRWCRLSMRCSCTFGIFRSWYMYLEWFHKRSDTTLASHKNRHNVVGHIAIIPIQSIRDEWNILKCIHFCRKCFSLQKMKINCVCMFFSVVNQFCYRW